MINYVSKTEYYDMETGEELTKRNTDENYNKLKHEKKYDNSKIYTKIDEKGEYKWGTITIIHRWYCEPKKQLKLF